jgi:hypothetical protein
MDGTGPVEVWTAGPPYSPPTYTQPEPRERGDKICKVPMIFYRYANGVEVKLDKGRDGGAIFYGEKGKMDLSRGSVNTNPPEIAEEIRQAAAVTRLCALDRGAFRPAPCPWPTWRSDTARSPFATWATSPMTGAGSAGTRPANNSSTIPMRIPIWIAPVASRLCETI